MSAKPEHYAELTRLISGLLDERLEAAERARLELLLESDPAARRIYLQLVNQEIELECLVVPENRTVPVPAAPARESARWTPRSYVVLAAAAIHVEDHVSSLHARHRAQPVCATAQQVQFDDGIAADLIDLRLQDRAEVFGVDQQWPLWE